jgi:hypothetical protein
VNVLQIVEFQMIPLPWFCSWRFAPVIIAFATGTGALCFWALHAKAPFDELDIGFYAGLYCSIGFITGIAAWYLPRLVASGRLPLHLLGIVLAVPYVFIVFLAFDKNPPIAVIATIAFGCIFGLAFAGAKHSTPE